MFSCSSPWSELQLGHLAPVVLASEFGMRNEEMPHPFFFRNNFSVVQSRRNKHIHIVHVHKCKPQARYHGNERIKRGDPVKGRVTSTRRVEKGIFVSL